jgi:hypothetical protein
LFGEPPLSIKMILEKGDIWLGRVVRIEEFFICGTKKRRSLDICVPRLETNPC